MFSRRNLITCSIMLCAVFLTGSVGAETVYLRGGGKITGTIVGQGRTWVALRVNGRRTVIRKSRIRRISYRRSRPLPVPGADKKKAAEDRRKKAAEARRKRREARERRRRAAERRRRAAARKKAAEERKRKAAAAALAKKKAEEERKRKAAAAALAKKKAEEERKRKAAAAALAKKKAEEERKRKAAAAVAAKKKAEDDKRKAAAAAAAKKKAEDDKRKAAAASAAKKKAEDDKRKAANVIAMRKKAEDEKKRKAAAAARKKAEIAALKRKQEDDRRKAIAMRKKAEDDKRRRAAAAKVAKKEDPKRDPKGGSTIPNWQAALWSAALPGLGQWFQGRKAEAITYGSLFGIGAVAAYEANRQVLNATRDYNETSNPFSTETLLQQASGISVIPTSADLADPAVASLYTSNFELQKQAVDDHYRNYQQYALFAGLIYAWNIADAFLADADPNYGYAAGMTPLKAAMWSAIIPGWGQWKTNRRNTGIFYASVVTVGLVGMYEKNRLVKNAARDYDQLNNPYSTSNLISVAAGATTGEPATDALGASIVDNQFRGQRDALDRHYREFQQLGYLTLAVYLWSVADAYLFTRAGPGRLTDSSAPSPAGLESRGFAVAPMLVPGNENEAPRAAMRFSWNFSF